MGISIRFIDTDALYDSLPERPFVANDYDPEDPEQFDKLHNEYILRYSGDNIESDAICACGETKGGYNEGIVCPYCGTEALPSTSESIENSMWIEAPECLKALILPHAWIILQQKLKASNFNYFQWLIDKQYKPSKESTSVEFERTFGLMDEAFGDRRGINNFITHFDEIIHFILNKTPIIKNRREREEFGRFCEENKRYFFPKHIPIPTKLCFILEDTRAGIYVGQDLGGGIDAVTIMATAASAKYKDKPQMVENRVNKALANLSAFYEGYVKNQLARKLGVFRKHLLGSRCHFTGRAVITSISDPHRKDELHIPYGMAVQILKYHITSKLLKRGYTPNEAIGYVARHVAVDSPLMRELLDELIAETPNGLGLVVSLTRNPSLRRGSTQRLYVTKIKDILDQTISLSPLILRESNADKIAALDTPR